MSDCIFCRIVAGELPAKVVFENEEILAFEDIAPKADTHILVIPKKHIDSLAHLQAEDAPLLTELTQTLPQIAEDCGLTEGFRTVVNTGRGGGQEVFHIHYHLLGGGHLPGF